ncbi:MAG: trehalose synthase, partial [Kofleriaceae bacterium]
WALFLRNHDELDLGRLTEAQRQRVFDALGPDKSMQLYDRGIRRRLGPMLDGDRRRLECAYSLLFTLPGTPVIRYGDELGMGDNLKLRERNAARTPMQWSNEPHGGFTNNPDPVLPVVSEGPYGYPKVNAADQRRDPQSLLNWTERIIRMRKEVPEIGLGEWSVVDTGDKAIFALRYDWEGNGVLVMHNLSGKSIEVAIRLGDALGRHLINLLAEAHSDADARGAHHIALEPYGYRWFRLGGLTEALD